MSTAAATDKTPGPARRPARLPLVISAMSGTTGLLVKIALLSVSNALAIWATYVMATRHNWAVVGALVAVTAAIDAVYFLRRGTLPLKFLVPGTVLLAAFQLIPIIYTIDVAFTNYSNGHEETKAQAIQSTEVQSLQQTGTTFAMAIAKAGGSYSLILQNQDTGKLYVGTTKGLAPAAAGSVTVKGGEITAAKGYTLVTDLVAVNNLLSGPLKNFIVPYGHGGEAIRPEGTTAYVAKPTLRYDAKRGVFISLADGTVYRDDGKGEFAHNGQVLGGLGGYPGWKAYIGGSNFSQIVNDPEVRNPFLNVFWWTFVFAAGTVFLSFAIGLFLAIALDKRGMRFQRLYRSILIIPWAVPGFLSLLVWAGLLNDSFGVVNRVLHLSIPWLFDPNWAKVSCILVSTWLTVPYFFVVSMGALQSIPEELVEAARVDGGSGIQIFRRITLPLLLVAVGPLLIASFAFNFNNFNNIYLLTGGGPTISGSSVAGATDILISYTYKLAIAQNLGSNYGLASAITIIIFLITAGISALGFTRTAVLEERI